jgi:hypothetical protein
MQIDEIKTSASDGISALMNSSDVSMRARQLECMRAHQTGRSWYEAYWYPEPPTAKLWYGHSNSLKAGFPLGEVGYISAGGASTRS